MIKSRLMVLVAVLSIAGSALAQSAGDRRGWGHLFGGVGGRTGGDSDATIHVGGGGDRLIKGGAGIGGELAYLTSSARSFGSGFGVASVNFGYHFGGSDASRKIVPFVSGGPSLAFRGGATAGGGNFGGGVHYWARDRVGLRIEFRDYIFSSDSPHNFAFRVGITFR